MDKLKALLQETFPHIDFEKEKNLVARGLLDSVDMVSIIALVTENFGVVVTVKYITPQNFESVENIWSMIQELSEEGKK